MIYITLVFFFQVHATCGPFELWSNVWLTILRAYAYNAVHSEKHKAAFQNPKIIKYQKVVVETLGFGV